MVFWAIGADDTGAALRGLYFYDVCGEETIRVAGQHDLRGGTRRNVLTVWLPEEGSLGCSRVANRDLGSSDPSMTTEMSYVSGGGTV